MSGQDHGWKMGTGVENRLIVDIVTSVSLEVRVKGYVIYWQLVYNLVCNKRTGQGILLSFTIEISLWLSLQQSSGLG